MRKRFLLLLIAIVMTGEVKAEDVKCTADDTVEGCFDKLGRDWASSRTEQSTAAVNTGVTGLLTPTQSTTKDFLSKLTAAFAVPMSGDGSRPVSLAWNIPIPRLGGVDDDDKEHLNLQAVFAKPQMSGELKERIGSNEAAMAKVNDSLSEFDDLTVRASFGPSMHGLGRTITPHKDAYEAMLGQQLDDVALKNEGVDRSTTIRAMATTPAAMQTAIETKISQFAERFSILLNNQSQFYGEVKYRALKNIAGPDERSVRLTYEKGFHNLKAFYRKHRGCAEAPYTTDLPAETCASLLIKAADVADQAREDRMAVSIEYRRWSALSVVIPDLVHYSAPRARSLVYSVTYGRNHMMMEQGRLDVEVNYEDTTARTVTDVVPPALSLTGDSKVVRDRFVASATYTYKINGLMAMPLTLTYANHGAYIGDVDRKLNAHFGLSFKMPP